jgi:hypothetical protein
MRNLLTSPTSRRRRIAGVIVWLLAVSSIGAQTPPAQTGIKLETGLQTFFTGSGRFIAVTVTEVGPPTAQSTVRIVYRDAADRVLMRDEFTLTREHPARLELPLTMPEPLVLVRATVVISGSTGGSSPIMVMEEIDRGSFTVVPRVSCSSTAPVPGMDPVLPNCPEVHPSKF